MNIRDEAWCAQSAAAPVTGSGLRYVQMSLDDWHRTPAAWQSSVLGVTPLGQTVATAPGLPQAMVQTPVLDGATGVIELWATDSAVRQGSRGAVSFRRTDEVLFGAIQLREADFAAGGEAADGCPDTPLRRATEAAYRQVFALLAEQGFPHLLRVWNYLPAINAEASGLERYRQFNVGRQDAFLAFDRPHAQGAPAACALGTAAGDLTVYFLAGRVPVLAIENPRQVSAYNYPHRYGPRAPTFSRAALARLAGQEILFVSGTASIVGHQTVHAGDVAAQTRETVANIRAVLAKANRVAAQPWGVEDLLCKVYVRHPQDLAVVRRELEAEMTLRVAPVYVQADVCRDDLLVEIEATAFAVTAV